jgi:poly(A) polymerase
MQSTAIQIVRTLQHEGHTAYWAGGCVRDALLKKEPKDFDIATSARPEQIEGLFKKTHAIGKNFGVITVMENGHHFEIATFRSDSASSDGRRPDAILFSHPAEDALRRDFTVNGLFYDPVNEEFHDFVGGRNDLQNKLIRFIGDPHQRILEDHLRILRAIRFKATLGFSYHADTLAALKHHAHLADKVSWERVRDELNKMITSSAAAVAIQDLKETGVLAHIVPEIDGEFSCNWPSDASLALRWAALFLHNEQSPEPVLRRLRFARRDMESVLWLWQHRNRLPEIAALSLGRLRNFCFSTQFLDLLSLFEMNQKSPEEAILLKELRQHHQDCLAHFKEKPQPFLTGQDLIQKFGIHPGPKLGALLEEAYELQLSHRLNSKEEAMEWVRGN